MFIDEGNNQEKEKPLETIMQIETLNSNILSRLLCIWETAVMQTHTFLSNTDIEQIKPDVEHALVNSKHLCGFYEGERMLGFIGIETKKIEMLFIDAQARGRGIGKQLLTYAVEHFDVRYVDVNEQNEQGVGFYLHMGFSLVRRSELDEQGRPFPILHMEKL